MGMASRGRSCAFVCSQRPLLLWAQLNKKPEVVASGKSRQTGSRCRAVGSMLDRWTMMAIVGRRWAKRGRLLADRQKRGFDGVAFVWWEREREEASFFFPWPGEKEGKSGFRFCRVLGCWAAGLLGRRLAGARWTQQQQHWGGLRGRRGAMACNTAHPSPRAAAGSSIDKAPGRQSSNVGSFRATCPSIHHYVSAIYLSIFARH